MQAATNFYSGKVAEPGAKYIYGGKYEVSTPDNVQAFSYRDHTYQNTRTTNVSEKCYEHDIIQNE